MTALEDLNLEELRAELLAEVQRIFPEYRLVPAKRLPQSNITFRPTIAPSPRHRPSGRTNFRNASICDGEVTLTVSSTLRSNRRRRFPEFSRLFKPLELVFCRPIAAYATPFAEGAGNKLKGAK
jgi:hypothetical protein